MSLLVMVQPVRADGVVSAVTVKGWCFNTTSCTGYAASPEASCIANGWPAAGAAIIEGWQYQCLWNGAYYGTWTHAFNVSSSCPVNSTGTTTCTCNAGYSPDATATACVAPACPVYGSEAGSYYVNTGDTINSIYNGQSGGSYCKDGCSTYAYLMVTSIPKPSLYKIIGGIKQYYSYRNYAYNGETCTAGDAQPLASTVPASDTCAPGE